MTSLELSTTSVEAGRARELLQRCCQGHCGGASSHACERRPEAVYTAIADPGRLDAVGPLAPGVQGRLRAISGNEVTRGNRVRLLVDGVQSYGAMLDLIENAESEILFENFIFRADAVGEAFAEALHGRAEDGVDVRILHDPFGSLMSRRAPIGFRFHGSAARVRVYNPPRPTPAFFRLGRDHRKLVVQDRQTLVAGGMCLADVWVGNCVSRCTWRDSAVWAQGQIAFEAAEEFERMWDRGVSFTPWRRKSWAANRSSGAAHPGAGTVPVRLVVDQPGERRVERILIEAIGAARSEILVTNSYLVPTRELADALCGAARRGTDVQVILPRTNNHRVVGLTMEHLVGPLLAAGVRVWLWTGPMIHAKALVIDRCWSLVGSSNLDRLSLRRNAEMNLEIHGTRFGEQMADQFARDRAGSVPFGLESWAGRPAGRRWRTRLAAIGRAWQ